jgi:hypothetical protein
MQMTREGKEAAEIRAFIDEKYSQFGPPTETEPVTDSQFSMAGPSLSGSTEAQAQEGGACGQAANSCQDISK